MKCKINTLLILLITSLSFGQEICNNAIDDDGDGLTDINDPECLCNLYGDESIASYIPNPSFEEFTTCPSGHSQLNYANEWQQSTNTTADFINTCGYIPNGITEAGLLPFPDGQGITGVIFSEEWKEYLGVQLTQSMEAGKSYQISFNIASLPITGNGDTCNNGIIDYGAVNITLYGAASPSALPVSTLGAPTISTDWIVLGTEHYQPISSWGELTIVFTPSVTINAVMLGAPETLAPAYANNSCYPYFLFDNLTLNESSFFGGSIIAQGEFCSGTLTLTAATTTSADSNTYQWYKEGIAIPGATAATLNIASTIPHDKYRVKISDNTACYITPSYTIIASMPDPVITITQPDCNSGTGIINIEANFELYSFDNGVTWSTSNTSPSLNPGNYSVKVKSNANCESNAVQVTLTPDIPDTPVVENIAYCQHSTAAQLTATGNNLLWYTAPAGEIASATAPTPSTAQTGMITYYVSQTINGCESRRTALNVTVNPTPPAPVTQQVIYYCQFDETQAIDATGTNLIWYTLPSGGEGSVIAPVPDTSKPGITNYYVSQNPYGCESARSLVSIIIFEAPAAPETKTYIAYNHYDIAQLLDAEGENLSWFNADGDYLPSAPRPDTSVLGLTAYYVSQSIDGCESKKTEIILEVVAKEAVLSFPKFFTPNGDGHNEIWNIAKVNNITDAEVTIYDRTGQLIKQVRPNDRGWDGTFNGHALPASDYWFRVIYNEYGVQKEYSSHFSLVR